MRGEEETLRDEGSGKENAIEFVWHEVKRENDLWGESQESIGMEKGGH